MGQAEEPVREEGYTSNCSIHPDSSVPAPEEDSLSATDVAADKTPESSSEMEPELAEEERQPESQEVDQSMR